MVRSVVEQAPGYEYLGQVLFSAQISQLFLSSLEERLTVFPLCLFA
jgi:hypothetical protein